MVFLTTYGFLNISSAIESWASPDFRPAFKIPRFVSLLGAVTCVVVMIQLDLIAMLGASAFMAALLFWLKRKQLTLEAGDTWQGIWSSLVRSGLFRLSQETEQRRNWRPNIVAFHAPDQGHAERTGAGDKELDRVAEALVTDNGILSDFVLARRQDDKSRQTVAAPRPGVFSHSMPDSDPSATILNIAQYHGLAGLTPNTVLLEQRALDAEPQKLAQLFSDIAALDKNLLYYRGVEARRDAEVRRTVS
jgi:hypothetical protein